MEIIRLLLLTGCRKGEITSLRWSQIDGDTIHLPDSKTGPRTVFLNAPAQAILTRQPRAGKPARLPFADGLFPVPIGRALGVVQGPPGGGDRGCAPARPAPLYRPHDYVL